MKIMNNNNAFFPIVKIMILSCFTLLITTINGFAIELTNVDCDNNVSHICTRGRAVQSTEPAWTDHRDDESLPWEAQKTGPNRNNSIQFYTQNTEFRDILDHIHRNCVMTSGDFNEDGLSDIVIASQTSDMSVKLIFLSGTKDLRSLYPNTSQKRKEDQEHPLQLVKILNDINITPDFMNSGDYNHDGYDDLILASRNSSVLFWLFGDGTFHFKSSKTTKLPGHITALHCHDIDKRDGRDDVVIGVGEKDINEIFIFQSKLGAGNAEPHHIVVDSPVFSIHSGRLNDDTYRDLVIETHSQVIILFGAEYYREESEKYHNYYHFETINLPFQITSLAVGDVIPDQSNLDEIIVLDEQGSYSLLKRIRIPTPVSGSQYEWLFVENNNTTDSHFQRGDIFIRYIPGNELITFYTSEYLLTSSFFGCDSLGKYKISQTTIDIADYPLQILPLRLNDDAFYDLVILPRSGSSPSILLSAPEMTFTVTNTDNEGPGSFRQALLDANASPSSDAIHFDIPQPGPYTITLQSPLPSVIVPVTIDGSTQPDFTDMPLIELDGSQTGYGSNGIHVLAGNSTIRGLIINMFDSNGIRLETSGYNIIETNFIGVDATGTIDRGNNGNGIYILSDHNTVGGPNVEARNIISANGGCGIYCYDTMAANNSVQNNYVGTDVTGTQDLGNDRYGILIYQAALNTIGGSSGEGNVISGNGDAGISIWNGALDTIILGNNIGCDVSGYVAVPNQYHGIDIGNTQGNIVGGSIPGAGNIISGNAGAGIGIAYSQASNNTIVSNYIGVTADGTSPLGNQSRGVWMILNGNNNRVGGNNPGEGNVIAYNGSAGIQINEGYYNLVRRNSIFNNFELGIDLKGDMVTSNDSGDNDDGPNGKQNFPIIEYATTVGCDSLIEGTLNSYAFTTFTIDFYAVSNCDDSGYGEGELYLGQDIVTTDSNGDANFSSTHSVPLRVGYSITTTATDPSGNTSEFSECIEIAPAATPGMITNLEWCSGTKDCLNWDPDPVASTYNLYRGEPGDLPNLLDDGDDSCLVSTYTDITTGNTVVDLPASGSFFWYLVTAVSICGEGYAGEATLKQRELNSTGYCP